MAEKKLTLKSLMDRIVSRPKPSAPKSGLKSGRYGNGGKVTRKKSS